MRIENYEQTNGDFYLLSPPYYINFQPFLYCLNYLKEWQESKWFGLHKDDLFLHELRSSNDLRVINKIDKLLSIFLSYFNYKCNHFIQKNTLTVEDLVNLIVVADKLCELSELPELPEITIDEDESINIKTTGDQVNDLIGDLISQFGGNAISIVSQLDFDSLRQVLNRNSQWNYWRNPKNQEKLKQEKDKESASKLLEKAFAAKANNTLAYLDGNNEPKLEPKDKTIDFNDL